MRNALGTALRVWLVIAGGNWLAACSSAESGSSEAPLIRRLQEPLCGLPDASELARDAVETPAGHWDYQEWLAAEGIQGQLPALQAVVERHRDRVLGVVPDHLAREVVVVLNDPEDADSVAELDASRVALPMRIQPACHSGAELRAIQTDFEARSWPEGTPAFAAHLDVALGRYVITLDHGSLPSGEFSGGSDTQPGSDLGTAIVRSSTRVGAQRWGSPEAFGRT